MAKRWVNSDVVRWVLDNSRAPATRRAVLISIASHCANADGTGAEVSVWRIAWETGLAYRTVQISVDALCKLGELAIVSDGGGATTTAYRVIMTGPSREPFAEFRAEGNTKRNGGAQQIRPQGAQQIRPSGATEIRPQGAKDVRPSEAAERAGGANLTTQGGDTDSPRGATDIRPRGEGDSPEQLSIDKTQSTKSSGLRPSVAATPRQLNEDDEQSRPRSATVESGSECDQVADSPSVVADPETPDVVQVDDHRDQAAATVREWAANPLWADLPLWDK